MKIFVFSGLSLLLLFAAGCDYDHDRQASYSTTPAYTSESTAYPSYRSSYNYTVSDGQLAVQVQRLLNEDPTLRNICSGVQATAYNGVITLAGTVPSEQDRELIENTIRNTAGVVSVSDDLRVVPIVTQPAAAIITQPTAPIVTTPTGYDS